jgi:C-terminal processing protease CtpA/Prc
MSNLTTALALRATRGLILLTSVIEDSRAFRAGIHPIDLITHINYRSVHGMTPDQAVEEMGGAPGAEVTLTIYRETLDLTFPVTVTH